MSPASFALRMLVAWSLIALGVLLIISGLGTQFSDDHYGRVPEGLVALGIVWLVLGLYARWITLREESR